MIDAVTYLKIKKRMTTGCTVNSDCLQCALYTNNNPYGDDCSVFETQYPEEAVAAVEKWAEEHPVKTRMNEFLKMFPYARIFESSGNKYVDICPMKADYTLMIECNGICSNCKIKYWSEEVKE